VQSGQSSPTQPSDGFWQATPTMPVEQLVVRSMNEAHKAPAGQSASIAQSTARMHRPTGLSQWHTLPAAQSPSVAQPGVQTVL
jgi:hypothetical protein